MKIIIETIMIISTGIFYKYLSDNEEKCWKEQLRIPEQDFVNIIYNETDTDMMYLIGECQKRIGYFIEYKYLFTTIVERKDSRTQRKICHVVCRHRERNKSKY